MKPEKKSRISCRQLKVLATKTLTTTTDVLSTPYVSITPNLLPPQHPETSNLPQALKTIVSSNWEKRSAAIDKIFTLLDAPHLSKYHRAQICSLLAKHGDEPDLEIAEYAIMTVELAQGILRSEKPRKGSCVRQAIEDLILDARDTLKIRCPDVQVPEDIMEPIKPVEAEPELERMLEVELDRKYMQGYDEDEDEDDESDEDDDEEDFTDDAEDAGNEEDQETSSDSAPCSTTSNLDISTDLSALVLNTSSTTPPNAPPRLTSLLPPSYSLSANPPYTSLHNFSFEVEPQDLHLLGLILMLVLHDRQGMERAVLRFARGRGLSDEEIAGMVSGAFIPRRVDEEEEEQEEQRGRKRRRVDGGDIGRDMTIRKLKFYLFTFFLWW